MSYDHGHDGPLSMFGSLVFDIGVIRVVWWFVIMSTITVELSFIFKFRISTSVFQYKLISHKDGVNEFVYVPLTPQIYVINIDINTDL